MVALAADAAGGARVRRRTARGGPRGGARRRARGIDRGRPDVCAVSRALGALLAASIWTGYLALIVRSLLAGRREVECGCSFGAKQHALGGFEVARNVVLSVMALGVAVVSLREGPAVAASQLLGAVAMLALYLALDQLRGLQPMRRGAVL